MENVYYDAYTEIYEILSYMPISYVRKLPKELLDLFEQKRNKDYKYHVNIDKKINEQDMLIETKSILANLYRDFWAEPEKREIILQKEENERNEYQNDLREKYNADNIFKKHKGSQYVRQDDILKEKSFSSNVTMVEYKESTLKMIINKIKKFFHLN